MLGSTNLRTTYVGNGISFRQKCRCSLGGGGGGAGDGGAAAGGVGVIGTN